MALEEVFEATLGGTNVEPIVVVETDVLRLLLLLRLVDADRMSWDMDVVAVTVEARARGALGFFRTVVPGAMVALMDLCLV